MNEGKGKGIDKQQGQTTRTLFYERERKTTTDRKRIVKKLRAHFQYIVKKRLHRTDYGIESIRAVSIETPDEH